MTSFFFKYFSRRNETRDGVAIYEAYCDTKSEPQLRSELAKAMSISMEKQNQGKWMKHIFKKK